MIAELKHCPFCGSDELQWDGHYVECSNCHAQGPNLYLVPDNDRVRYWNARHESDELPEWLKDRIIDNYEYTERLKADAIMPEVAERLTGYNSALEWVLSLRKSPVVRE